MPRYKVGDHFRFHINDFDLFRVEKIAAMAKYDDNRPGYLLYYWDYDTEYWQLAPGLEEPLYISADVVDDSTDPVSKLEVLVITGGT